MTTYMAPFPRGTRVSQPFGSLPNNGVNPAGGHTGEDFAVPVGTPVHAAGDGIIRHSDWFSAYYNENPWWLTQMGGDTLVLDCTDAFGQSDGYPTFVYAHLSESTANVGDKVRKGQVIGKSGNSGTATTGPHCHVEVLPPNWDWNNGTYGRVNPDLYFTEYPDDIQVQSSTPQEEFTVAQYEELIKQIGLTHAKENNIAKAVNDIAAKNQLFHGQSHAKLNAIKEVVDQIAAGQGVTIDWAKVEAAAAAGAAKAMAENVIKVDVSVVGQEVAK